MSGKPCPSPEEARRRWAEWSKPCNHETLNEVRNEAGKIIAELCAKCGARIAEYGICDGCKIEKRLVRFVMGAKPKRFHNEECRVEANKAKQKAVAGKGAKP